MARRTFLNVAEKNDAAKGISGILSRGQYNRRNGASVYNKIYSFRYFFRGEEIDMVVTSVSGHLLDTDFSAEYSHWNAIPPSRLFDAQIVTFCSQNNLPLQNSLQREARRADTLIIWTDCDREGENIGFEIIAVCQAVKPHLQVFRARFSEITSVAINRAMQNLVDPDPNVNDAVECRKELDLRTGAAFTRLQTLQLRLRFPQILQRPEHKVISYGSCQFPTLGFVVERYKRIQDFVREPFWKLVLKHKRDGQNTEFRWARLKVFVKEACQVLLDMCLENKEATVVKVDTKPKTRWRPVALETVQLEKLAVRKLRMTAKQAMTVAEKLYTKGFISYPRTETNRFPPDLNLERVVQELVVDHRWGQFATDVLQRGINPRNGTKTDQAHPPIHPTKYAAANTLQGDEYRLYELIVRHFLACISLNAEGLETTVELSVATSERFYATGLIITNRGYLEVYPYEQWNAHTIPRYIEGEKFMPDLISMTEGETAPPQLLTEADLIALMDKHGIGTDATHAQHIETIKQRSYVGMRQDGRFIPGYLGLGLVEGYDDMGCTMSKPNLRAEFEEDLKKICAGQKTKQQVLAHYVQKYRQIFQQAEQDIERLAGALRKYWANNPPPPPQVQQPPAIQQGRGRARGRGRRNN